MRADAGASIFANDTEISDNSGHGLHVGRNSFANVRSVTITGNTGDGVHVELGSGFELISPSTAPTPGSPTNVSGNAGTSVRCGDSLSWVSGDLSGVERPIKCPALK